MLLFVLWAGLVNGVRSCTSVIFHYLVWTCDACWLKAKVEFWFVDLRDESVNDHESW